MVLLALSPAARLAGLTLVAWAGLVAAGCGSEAALTAGIEGTEQGAAQSLSPLEPAAVGAEGARLVDERGEPVVLHGLNWFGFNTDKGMVHGLWSGDGIAGDFARSVWRQKLLGFNAVRLPFSFAQFARPIPPLAQNCSPASDEAVIANVTDPSLTRPPAPSLAPRLPAPPPAAAPGRCNAELPTQGTVQDLFVYVVRFYVANGFYVLVDNHFREDTTALDSPEAWARAWGSLAGQIMQDPASRGRVFFDLLNEPDEHGLSWQARGTRPGTTALYLSAMDQIWSRTQDAIFFVEGSGQGALGANWGDGFCTQPATLQRLGLDDPRPFFAQLATRPYARRTVLSPHVYGPKVTSATRNFSGEGLYTRLNDSFGDLTLTQFPVAVGEFGSFFDRADDIQFMQDFRTYLRGAEGGTSAARHRPIDLWFYWSWNPNSGDTGGLVTDDWVGVQWTKLRYLTELGLRPWYLAVEAAAAGRGTVAPPPSTPAAAPGTPSTPAAAAGPSSTPAPATGTSAAPRPAAGGSAAAVPAPGVSSGAPSGAAPRPAPAPTPLPAPQPAPAGAGGSSAAGACRVRLRWDALWEEGGGRRAGALALVLRPGSAATRIVVPYTVELSGLPITAVRNAWNLGATALTGAVLRATVEQDAWKSLLGSSPSEVQVGFTLGLGAAPGPGARVTINGQACELVAD